ncbi:MAG: fumarylacetoacetase [Nocardioidaceae bacterium]|nr:fumarylacetoacetase [Nocardioidaceae bacterium]
MGATATSWVDGATGSLFDADNLPYAVFARSSGASGDPDEQPRVGVRIGSSVVDLAPLAASDFESHAGLFAAPSLNPLMAAGPAVWAEVRAWLQDLLTNPAGEEVVDPHLVPLDEVELHLPFDVADYVDFYASLEHATNVGRILRPDGEPLAPNWRHLPVGYHGRAGTVVVSGTDVRRPSGQRRPTDATEPDFGPSTRLDLEAELGFVVGVPTQLGTAVAVSDFEAHVFGVVGLNDWSARDIQAWEYVPLGPFLGKSFATSVSAWVTPLAALTGARTDVPEQRPEPLAYLRGGDRAGFDIAVEIELNGEVVARPPYASMYWSPAQMLAHLTVNGASLRTGDLYGSGTISGAAPEERGSLLELSWGGQEPFVAGGRERTFLEDGDEVVLRYTAPGELGPIGLGEVAGRILPASPPDRTGSG